MRTKLRSRVGLAVGAAVLLAACGSGTSTTSPPSTETDGHTHTHDDPATGGHDHDAAVAVPLSYTKDGLIDSTKVDLSGIAGVSPTQQAQAEALLKSTIELLPQWSDPAQAEADGFESIGDGFTGEEHFIHWDWIDDTVILDPNRPESLVYKVDPETGTKTLEAAMFIMPKQYSLDSPPSIASPLVQFHIHDNLCFTAPPAPKVRGLTNGEGGCTAPLVKFQPNAMAHVWIRQNDCGPFAALLGVGGGQIKPGEEVACDHDHGRIGL